MATFKETLHDIDDESNPCTFQKYPPRKLMFNINTCAEARNNKRSHKLDVKVCENKLPNHHDNIICYHYA